MGNSREKLPKKSSRRDIDAFLKQVAATPPIRSEGKRGRLIFAMDATASRKPTWDRACQIQGQMFEETAAIGGLDVQLSYYRGYRELEASHWVSSPADLLSVMCHVSCAGGMTQIARVLRHAIRETKRERVHALVFVGDCMEELPDELYRLAGELGLLGVPVFMFHEGGEPLAESTFREVARLSRGAYCRFDPNSAQQLRELLGAVAVYAAGGRRALEDLGKTRGGLIKQLTHQLK